MLNGNMFLRLLLYVARLYNGVKEFPEEKVCHLSDAFIGG